MYSFHFKTWWFSYLRGSPQEIQIRTDNIAIKLHSSARKDQKDPSWMLAWEEEFLPQPNFWGWPCLPSSIFFLFLSPYMVLIIDLLDNVCDVLFEQVQWFWGSNVYHSITYHATRSATNKAYRIKISVFIIRTISFIAFYQRKYHNTAFTELIMTLAIEK